MDKPFESYDIETYFGEVAREEAHEIAKEIVEEIRASEMTGVKYVNKVPVDTGRLRDSYEATRTEYGAEVTSDVEYRDYVEYGTRYMQAQPHVRPAIEAVKRRRGMT